MAQRDKSNIANTPQPEEKHPALRWWRNTALLYGLVLLIWFSLEDNQTLSVVAFGVCMALLWGWRARQKMNAEGLPFPFLIPVVLGLLVGAGAAVMTTGLMFFKTAWHAHLYPDYPPEMMLAMLTRTPAWAVAGALLAAAWTLGKVVVSPAKGTP